MFCAKFGWNRLIGTNTRFSIIHTVGANPILVDHRRVWTHVEPAKFMQPFHLYILWVNQIYSDCIFHNLFHLLPLKPFGTVCPEPRYKKQPIGTFIHLWRVSIWPNASIRVSEFSQLTCLVAKMLTFNSKTTFVCDTPPSPSVCLF